MSVNKWPRRGMIKKAMHQALFHTMEQMMLPAKQIHNVSLDFVLISVF